MPTYKRTNEDTDAKNKTIYDRDDEESLESPIKTIENENPDIAKQYADQLGFLHKKVRVRLSPTYNKEDSTRLKEFAVNGETFFFLVGEWKEVPLYVLEVLATSKPRAWEFGYKMAPNGRTVQQDYHEDSLRFPHQFQSQDPEVLNWYDSIKDNIY